MDNTIGGLVPHKSIDEDLIRPAEAARIAASYVGNEYQARLLIADGLHSGTVWAFVEKLWEQTNGYVLDEWTDLCRHAKLMDECCFIDRGFWQASLNWPSETRYWDWDAGNFLINGSLAEDDPLDGYLLEKVYVSRGQIMDLLENVQFSGLPVARCEREQIATLWISFVYSVSDGFDWTIFDSPLQLKQAMIDTSAGIFADNNLDFAVSMAWEGLVKRRARENLASRRLD